MLEQKTITGLDEAELWQKINTDFQGFTGPAEYHAVLEFNDRRILLDIHEEAQKTIFSSYIFSRNDYRFSIKPQGFIEEMGKLMGMQDVILGYKEFDDKFIVQTNEESRTELLFADPAVRTILEEIPGLCFGIVQYVTEEADGKAPFLELSIDGCIADTSLLQQLFQTFFTILIKVDS